MKATLPLLAASLLLLCGCLTLEETWKFSADGTCLVTWHCALPLEWVPFAQEAGRQLAAPGAQFLWIPSENEVKQYLTQHQELELRHYRQQKLDGRLDTEIVFLLRDPLAAFAAGLFPGLTLEQDQEGKFTLRGEPLASNRELTSSECEKFRPLLQQASLTMTVQTAAPDGIAGNGRQLAQDTLRWHWCFSPQADEFSLLKPAASLHAQW